MLSAARRAAARAGEALARKRDPVMITESRFLQISAERIYYFCKKLVSLTSFENAFQSAAASNGRRRRVDRTRSCPMASGVDLSGGAPVDDDDRSTGSGASARDSLPGDVEKRAERCARRRRRGGRGRARNCLTRQCSCASSARLRRARKRDQARERRRRARSRLETHNVVVAQLRCVGAGHVGDAGWCWVGGKTIPLPLPPVAVRISRESKRGSRRVGALRASALRMRWF